jgi:hypothetical protein
MRRNRNHWRFPESRRRISPGTQIADRVFRKKPADRFNLLQIGQSWECQPQFPEPQQEGTLIEKAWHGDCFIVAAARFGARNYIISNNQPKTFKLPMCKSKSLLAALAMALVVAGMIAAPSLVSAQEAPAAETTTVVVEAVVEETAAAEPTVEQRLADLEAYINNAARTPDVASKVNVPGPGHNAWQMTSTALVLFMTLPGLALFYGGLVRSKNVLSILAMCMGIAGLVTILWWLCGYSLTFGGTNPFIGDLSFAMFNGMSPSGVGAGYYWISDYVWAMFQLTFAIITPALIFGATAERMKISAVSSMASDVCFISPC